MPGPDQPMPGGFGGFSVVPKPKKPRKTRKDLVKEAADKFNRSLSESAILLEELSKSPVFGQLVQTTRERLIFLIRKDPTIMAYLSVLAGWKRVIDAPRFAEAELTKLMGPELTSIVPPETQAAP